MFQLLKTRLMIVLEHRHRDKIDQKHILYTNKKYIQTNKIYYYLDSSHYYQQIVIKK